MTIKITCTYHHQHSYWNSNKANTFSTHTIEFHFAHTYKAMVFSVFNYYYFHLHRALGSFSGKYHLTSQCIVVAHDSLIININFSMYLTYNRTIVVVCRYITNELVIQLKGTYNTINKKSYFDKKHTHTNMWQTTGFNPEEISKKQFIICMVKGKKNYRLI